jgi:hypothetical protein
MAEVSRAALGPGAGRTAELNGWLVEYEAVEDLEYVEFSPADEQKRTLEVMQQNLGR